MWKKNPINALKDEKNYWLIFLVFKKKPAHKYFMYLNYIDINKIVGKPKKKPYLKQNNSEKKKRITK